MKLNEFLSSNGGIEMDKFAQLVAEAAKDGFKMKTSPVKIKEVEGFEVQHSKEDSYIKFEQEFVGSIEYTILVSKLWDHGISGLRFDHDEMTLHFYQL